MPQTSQVALKTITAAEVLAWLADDAGREVALLDVRPPRTRVREQIAVASGLPYQDIERHIALRVPHLDTPIVLTGDGPVERAAAAVLTDLGYLDVRLLEGGHAAWKAAGGRLYNGTNVRSKTLGEWIEHVFKTPTVDPGTVADWRAQGRNVLILDSRPHDEYLAAHIPGGVDTGGGAELALRAHQLATSEDTVVVVNCAGRTRGIVGAQSVINSGIGNEVWFLRNGTPEWRWAGLPIEAGEGTQLQLPRTPPAALTEWAKSTLDRVDAQVIDAAQARKQLADETTTTYWYDVRTPEEFAARHVAGSRLVQGGQLIQESDVRLAVHGATVVLIDEPDFVRSATTAQWLRYLHAGPILLTTVDTLEGINVAPTQPKPEAAARVSPAELDLLRGRGPVRVFDLRSSWAYAAGHIPGSVHARREQLDEVLSSPADDTIVLVAEAGAADYIAARAARSRKGAVVTLDPSDAATVLTKEEPRYAGEIVDLLRPREPGEALDAFIRKYFDWEYSLVPASDGDPHFAFERIRAELDQRQSRRG